MVSNHKIELIVRAGGNYVGSLHLAPDHTNALLTLKLFGLTHTNESNVRLIKATIINHARTLRSSRES